MTNHVTGWLEVAQYEYKRAISTSNLVETTWMSRNPRLTEITYEQGKEVIGHKLRKSLIEMEYGITAKPSTSGIYYVQCSIGKYPPVSRKHSTEF